MLCTKRDLRKLFVDRPIEQILAERKQVWTDRAESLGQSGHREKVKGIYSDFEYNMHKTEIFNLSLPPSISTPNVFMLKDKIPIGSPGFIVKLQILLKKRELPQP